MAEILIRGGRIINRGEIYTGYIIVEGDFIRETGEGEFQGRFEGRVIDAAGKYVMPGVIDDQVHFREPGLEYKADIHSESRAAAAGGVTSFMEMPNTVPATVTRRELEDKFERAARSSAVNYSFYFGATNDNIDEIRRIDPREVCGVKLFMGLSTGNMLMDNEYALSSVFAESPVLIATHCESESIIREKSAMYRSRFEDDPPANIHPLVRSAEACYRSSAKAVELADKYGSNLHVLHLSTGRELALFDRKPLADKKITNEVCVHHLWFDERDYGSRGNFIKWNPAIKTLADRDALRAGLLDGKVDIIATDHAPHTLEEKNRSYWDCPSGGPLVQFSLQAMLELSARGILPLDKVVEKMCHAPAVRFAVNGRGFIDEGCYADIVIVDPGKEYIVTSDKILSKCGWSPLEDVSFTNTVEMTMVNGRIVWESGMIHDTPSAMALRFDRG